MSRERWPWSWLWAHDTTSPSSLPVRWHSADRAERNTAPRRTCLLRVLLARLGPPFPLAILGLLGLRRCGSVNGHLGTQAHHGKPRSTHQPSLLYARTPQHTWSKLRSVYVGAVTLLATKVTRFWNTFGNTLGFAVIT